MRKLAHLKQTQRIRAVRSSSAHRYGQIVHGDRSSERYTFAAGAVSAPIKQLDPQTRALIDEAIRARGGDNA